MKKHREAAEETPMETPVGSIPSVETLVEEAEDQIHAAETVYALGNRTLDIDLLIPHP